MNPILVAASAIIVLLGPVIGASATANPGDDIDQSIGGQECQVNEKLVNSCRPWLGARSAQYPEAGNSIREQHEYHEQRISRAADIVHTFAAPGSLPLASEAERELATRDATYVYQNWKPAAEWETAAGGDAEMNAHIDAAAENIAAVAPNKIFLTIHHEPENDVSSDSECATKGDAGTAQQYLAMWHNVRERFDAKGIDNVVWVMDYMNYRAWDCLVPKLYPGDDYVDWIMFNGYGTGSSPDFASNVDHFYQLLSDLSSADMDLESKPWGLAEWGISDASQEQARDYYAQAAQSIEDKLFPRLQAYMIFDSPGTHADSGLRVGYDDRHQPDPLEQDSYNDFANNPAFIEGTAAVG